MRRFVLGALSLSLLLPCFGASAAQADFGINQFDVRFEDSNGSPELQAGAHPFQMTTEFELKNEEVAPEEFRLEEAKSAVFEQIAGFVGNANAVQTCPGQSFVEAPSDTEAFFTKCPADTAVGYVALGIDARIPPTSTVSNPQNVLYAPVFNVEPTKGWPAALGFSAAGLRILVNVGVKEGGDYNIVASSTQLPQAKRFIGAKLVIWGVPADSRHDSLRGTFCMEQLGFESCPSNSSEKAFITLPRACVGALATRAEFSSWANPLAPPSVANALTPGVQAMPKGFSGCERLDFAPSIKAKPSAASASTSTGMEFSVDVEDEGLTSPSGLAQSDIQTARVTLPNGLVVNPSVATGLQACSEGQLSLESSQSGSGAGCPEGSKIGTVEVETPLLKQSLQGSLYVASPFANPFNSLLGFYMVIKNSELGISIRQPVRITADSATGQLVATAGDIPQIPFSHLKLRFREGPRSPLTTPRACGAYAAEAVLTPRAGGTPATVTSAFSVAGGAGGSPCPPGGVGGFDPTMEAGTVAPLAAQYSPFVLSLKRDAADAPFKSIEARLPEGLLGKLAGVKECSEAQIASAVARSAPNQGSLELSSPSCPPASEVGTVAVGAGSGTPTFVQGRAYLAGPYKGAPLSLAIITPAVTGPFDLGTVVVRSAIFVDPTTAQIRAVSDPLPTILQGIPLDVRSVIVDFRRPQFTLNPTSCDTMAVLGSVSSVFGQSSNLSSRFQVGGCRGLDFKPQLSLNLKGATKRGGFPALTAVVTAKAGEANIAHASVALPHSEFLAQAHIRTVCTRVQFAAGGGGGEQCPKGSIYGRARAFSPLIDRSLEGPVYLRSSSNPLPDLVAALDGQIHVDLVGRIDSKRGGIRTTFAKVPDAPVSKFVLKMKGGKKGLLVNSTNLCRATHRATYRLGGHNGKAYNSSPALSPNCGAARKGKKAHPRAATR